MKLKSILFLLALLLVLSPLAYSQSRDTGAIVGTITDDEGGALPGVTVTLTGTNMMGERTVITDAQGQYRFPALRPGIYVVKATLDGFADKIQESIRVTTTVRLTIDLTMTPRVQEEEVTVVAESPTVDVKSTETASVTLSDEILRNIPYSNFAMDIVNLAPGVSGNVAYGASANTGVSYQVDGVDVSDPDAGSAWVFVDPNIVEEAKVMGLGLNAEYGNFTGVIFNLVTKSGGNNFSGHGEFIYQGTGKRDPDTGQFTANFWQADNTGAYQDDFSDPANDYYFTPSGLSLYDIGVHVGGPIMRDKLWFFTGGQWYHTFTKVTGFPEDVEYKQPRAFIKLTSQLTGKTNMTLFFENDNYTGINRSAGARVEPNATVGQVSPDYVGNFALTHILSETTFLDFKGAFFIGYYYLDPESGPDVSAHYSINDRRRYDSAGWFFYADRDRYQTNASITHYAEDFIAGDHDFKFGVEFEYGKVRNRYGYTGPNHMYYVDYVGYGYTGNYLAYQYEGYDTNTNYTRLEAFFQDGWKLTDRLNVTLGLRVSQMWGTVKGISGAVYEQFRLAPRVGFTYDILGDKTTVFKAHFGQFTEAMYAGYHDRLNPPSAYSDSAGYYWDLGTNTWTEFYRIQHEDLYTMDPDIKHPYMNQFTVSIERELFRDTSFTVAYIWREWKNIIGPIDTKADWQPVTVNVSEINESFTVYEQVNAGENAYYLKNIVKGDPYISLDPYRKYWGIQLTFNKRFSNKWQLLASYVYSHATGTIDNGFADDIGWGGDTSSPNFWINADGTSTNDNTHMLKVQGTYVFPLGINLNVYWRAITGDAWTRRYRTSRLAHGRVTFFTQPRGSNHYDIQNIFDMRLEKSFTFAGKYRLGLMIDIFNLFNVDTITSWGTRIGYDWNPGTLPSAEGHDLYGLVRPRQIRIGGRITF